MKVSIITPTFNHEAFIGECIESVLAQTYPEWEQIIVDDGSTDRTWEIVTTYARQDPRIRILRREHKGVWHLGELYNMALSLATGELVAILEGDDWWPSNKLVTQIEQHMACPDAILSCGKVIYSKGTGLLNTVPPPPLGHITFTKDYLRHLLLASAHCQPVTLLINRNALKQIGGFIQPSYFPAVDFPTTVALSTLSGAVVWTNEVMGYYRLHSSQVTKSMGVELIEGRLRHALETYSLLEDSVRSYLKLSQELIIDAHRNLLSDAYLARLRYDLISRNKEDLNHILPKLWRIGTIKRKTQVLYAFIAIRVGWTMEPILDFVSLLRNQTQKLDAGDI